jgi:hypothetical protein
MHGAVRVAVIGFLLLAGVLPGAPATAAGAPLFIGQYAVEDARRAAQPGRVLHYRIVHDEPGLLAGRLAGWIDGAGQDGDAVTFSLDDYPVSRTRPDGTGHLASSFLIDFAEPGVQALHAEIAARYGPRPAPGELARFVYDYIADKNVAHGFDVASAVARSRAGDCTEHAVLLTALLRMYGYPARTVVGLFVSLDEAAMAYGHAWAEYHDGAGWIGLDATTRVAAALDARYIPLGTVADESIGYRLAAIGLLRALTIRAIVVE